MVKCEVIKEFTLERFNELQNIQRKRIDTQGKLYVGDTFECEKDLADYLLGANPIGKAVVKVIEVIPAKVEIKEEQKVEKIETSIKEEKPKTPKKKKSSKK